MPRQAIECPECQLCYACHAEPVSDVPFAKMQGRCETCAVSYLAGYYNGADGEIPARFREFVDLEWLAGVAETMRGPSTKDEKRCKQGVRDSAATEWREGRAEA